MQLDSPLTKRCKDINKLKVECKVIHAKVLSTKESMFQAKFKAIEYKVAIIRISKTTIED
jgi:predicted neutral ceramidase superfamily lipid hydrolase